MESLGPVKWIPHSRRIQGRARRELAARGLGPSPAPPSWPASDPFAVVLAQVREHVRARPRHDAWALLDRPAVDGLLDADAADLGTWDREKVWRLGTIFAGA